MTESTKGKPRDPEVLRKERIKQVRTLATKLMNTSPSHAEAAYWETIVQDMEKVLSGPLD